MQFFYYKKYNLSRNPLYYNILANEFLFPKVKEQLDDEAFKYALDCLDESDNIIKMAGKADEHSSKMIQEARMTYQKFGYQ